jgi:N-acetylglucosamine-6-phosphate deacetylase
VSGFLLRGRLFTPDVEIPDGSVLVRDGVVAWAGRGLPPDGHDGAELVGSAGAVVAPGFIDLQVNGYLGRDCAEGPDAVAFVAAQLPETGVTGFLPTAITAPLDDLVEFPASCLDASRRSGVAARILGAHVEGPFLDPGHRGAHDADLMLEPTPERVERFMRCAPRMMTVAPELPGAQSAIRTLVEAGIVVAAGHSGATLEQARSGFEAGIRFGTHLYNAMSPLRHREPGLAGALLTEPRAVVGLIADGLHVHAGAVQVAIGMKGPGGVALTTDMASPAGMPPGRYRLGGRPVVRDGMSVRLEDGTLAGSAAVMPELIRQTTSLPGVGLRQAIEMATLTPARLLRLWGAGRIAAGLPADLVLLDEDLDVRLTLAGGQVAFRA